MQTSSSSISKTNNEQSANKEDAVKVQIKFVTFIEKYQLPETTIYLPTHLRRHGLSEIVNHLLGTKDHPVPFDFLYNGEFLKTSLQEFMLQKDLSTESVLEIEYIESTLPPTPLAAYQHDDWVSSIRISHDGLIMTGSYDHHVRVWDQASNCLATLGLHRAPVLSVDWVPQESGVQILSASQDQTIIAWKKDTNGNYDSLFVAKGHTKPVLAVKAAPNLKQFATSSADSLIKIWTLASLEEDQENVHFGLSGDNSSNGVAFKKRKGDSDRKVYKGASVTLEGHFGPVNGLAYDSLDSSRLFSGGHDHAMRAWDITTATNIFTKTCDKPFLDLDHGSVSNLLASGHTDPLVRIWDPRVGDSAVIKLAFSGHNNWVSGVQWQDNSQYRLVSSSYDGHLKIWDLRSRTPQFTLSHGEKTNITKYDPRTVKADHPVFQNKVFALALKGQLLASGGQDSQLKLHRLPSENL